MKYLNYYVLLVLLLSVSSLRAQTTNSESFDGTTFVPAGWTNEYVSGTTSQSWSRVTSGTFPTQSPHSGAGEAKFASWSYSNSVRCIITPAYDLSGRGSNTPTVTFWMYRDGGYSSNTDKIEVMINTAPTQGGATLLGTINRSRYLSPSEGSDGWYQYSYNVPGAFSGSTNYLIFKATSDYGNNIYIDDVSWTSYPPPCSGTPAPGNTIASSNPICPANGATLSLQNATTGGGVSYQWQQSTNGTTYTNVASNGNLSTYFAQASTTTYYRCQVTCGANTGTSTPVMLTVNNFMTCYCEPQIGGSSYNGCNDNDQITNVTMNTLNNSSTCSGNTYAYIDYTGSVAPTSLTFGNSYNISVSTPGQWTDNIVAWIDYDHSGSFDASEFVAIGTATSSNATVNTNWALNKAGLTGDTRMRVKLRYSTTQTASSSCDESFSYGECEDYLVSLTCPSNVTISTNPTNTSTCVGSNASFTAAGTATSGWTVTYQWQESTNGGSTWADITNNAIYGGATTGTLTITGATGGMGGYQYRCKAINDCGSFVTTNAATLSFKPATTVIVNPVSVAVCPGATTNFSVTATGNNLTYQWQLSTNGGSTWNNISNGGKYNYATTAAITITNATSDMNGYKYRCVVSGECPSATSTDATLTINTVPSFVAEPTSQITICPNSNVNISVTAAGTGVTYQWQEFNTVSWSNMTNGAPYSGVNTATLSISSIPASHANYQYRCVISGTCAPTLTSSSCKINIVPDAVVSLHPSTITACSGTSSTMSCAASVSAPSLNTVTYQWQESTNGGTTWGNVSNGALYSGVTTDVITFVNTSISLDGNQYRCVIKNACNSSVNTNAATLNVVTSPVVSAQPSNKTICAGSNTSFSVTATSPYTIVYKWEASINNGPWFYLGNNTTYSGVSTPTLTVTNAQPTNNNTRYRCELFTGCVPATTSNAALLTVNSEPIINTQPVSRNLCEGDNVNFSVATSGNGLSYIWQESTNNGVSWNNIVNGGKYSGANTNVLKITALTPSFDNNRYRCLVNGVCPTNKTSNEALLNVKQNVHISTQTTGTTTICSGGNATFSVTTSGPVQSYQWYIQSGNSYLPLSNSGFYSGTTTSTLTINGITAAPNTKTFAYICKITGPCSGDGTNPIYLTVQSKPAITLSPSSVIICDSVNNIDFNCAASGANISYQWQMNTGSGWVTATNTTNISGVSTAQLHINQAYYSMNGYQFRCIASGSCTPAVTSGTATLTVNQIVHPSVTISASSTDICDGESVKFTPAPINGGSNPTYIWKKNNVNVATGSTYTTTSLANNDFVSCQMTSNANCAVPSIVQSNQVLIRVNQRVLPTIVITSDVGTSWCTGKPATFRATTTFEGATPSYQWKLNGVDVGPDAPVYTAPQLNDGDQIKCELTSNYRCATPAKVVSNTIDMTINLTTRSSIVISANPDTSVCQQTEVTLYSAFTNGGATPAWQWMLNGIDIPGETKGTLKTKSLQDGDAINCRFISSNTCVFPEISNPITFDVGNLLTPSVTVLVSYNGGNSYTFTAVPVNGGPNPKYQWFKNMLPILGETNSTYTTSSLATYDDIHVQMVSNEECADPSKLSVTSKFANTGVGEVAAGINNLRLHPNPNTGSFTISGELPEGVNSKGAVVKITNAVGQMVYNQSYPASGSSLKLDVQLGDNLANGLYTVSLVINDNVTNIRFMLNR